MLKSSVSPNGHFVFGIHKPKFNVKNLREKTVIKELGCLADGTVVNNGANLPTGDVEELAADWIYEIPNPLPFRGTTFITRRWAAAKAENPNLIRLSEPQKGSLKKSLKTVLGEHPDPVKLNVFYQQLPEPLLYALATASNDPEELKILVALCCQLIFDSQTGEPTGFQFRKNQKGLSAPCITNHTLFEIVVNNHSLPDVYKEVMVLRPGVQGGSEIVGEWQQKAEESHIFEYLRRNSYIPWGHYAANMADDAIRYRLKDLRFTDLEGLRHLFYQRTYVRLADQLGIIIENKNRPLSAEPLENLRAKILKIIESSPARENLLFNRTLWGWNFGFDYAPSQYRLHASHQQIHQQYAMIPTVLKAQSEEELSPYACGDLIEDFIVDYEKASGIAFFEAYLEAIRSNKRLDGIEISSQSLIIYEDENIIVFVPKAQTSQWELQLMTTKSVGNILEADAKTRRSIDRGIFVAVRCLSALGAKMITSIEFSKRFELPSVDQRLLYAFLPKLPESPGAFSEAQLRWINGHYPEDFATVCRDKVPAILDLITR